jgi:hypothetical protein
MLTMFDSIDLSAIPSDAQFVAAYVGGLWPTYDQAVVRFPHATILSVAVSASENADCLDVEAGDATVGQVAAWVKRQAARATWQPCLYASVDNMPAVLAALTAADINLSDCRFWSAHYTGEAHVCGPTTCKAIDRPMTGTQWTGGANLDQSLLDNTFFQWYISLMADIPTVQPGSTGQAVKNWQGLLGAHGHAVAVDGSFGPATETATKAYQTSAGLADDGVVGQNTWTAALAA